MQCTVITEKLSKCSTEFRAFSHHKKPPYFVRYFLKVIRIDVTSLRKYTIDGGPLL